MGKGDAWLAALLRGDAPRTHPGWSELLDRARRTAAVLLSRYGVWTIDADDVAQDVVMRLYSAPALRRLRASGSVDGYLFVMIRNRVFDEIRRNRVRWRESAEGEYAEDSGDGDLSLDQRIALEEVLDELSPDEHTLIRLRFWEDRSIGDIAAELGLSYSAASVRIFRLLRKLRERLQS